MGRYDGKTAVVTGGASGMGLATTRLLVNEGVRVLATGRTQAVLDSAAESIGPDATFVRSDAASLDDIEALAEHAQSLLNGVDLLFLNAGVASPTPFADVTPALWDEVFGINVRGPYFTAQRFVPILNDHSAIVLTTSIANEQGLPRLGVYSASKAALRSLARSLARDLAPRIRVNAVSPGPIETPIIDKIGLPSDAIAGYRQATIDENPSQRWGQGDEIARAVTFLAFEATFTTGHELPVDGGLSQL